MSARLPAYTTSEQTSQAMVALAGVIAFEARTRLYEQTMAAQDAFDCLCLAVEAVAAHHAVPHQRDGKWCAGCEC